MSKILLVTLIHNRKHLLTEAVNSAISQTLDKSEWTHLLIDNASTDGADKLAEVFAKKYDHIKFIKMDENIGQQRAYNYVLDEWIPKNMPNAEMLVVLDSDDRLKPIALQEVTRAFNSHKAAGQIYSGFNIINKAGKITTKNHPKARLIKNQLTEDGQRQLRKVFLSQNPIGHLRAFRVSCLKDIGGFNTNYEYATDYNIAGRMLQKHMVIKIDKVLYDWRQHDTQVERQHSPQQTKDWKEMQKEFGNIFLEKGII